jgi:hypothetical protein
MSFWRTPESRETAWMPDQVRHDVCHHWIIYSLFLDESKNYPDDPACQGEAFFLAKTGLSCLFGK